MIYTITGWGRGKTTSALGIALRALANNEKVLFVQFLKDGKDGGIDILKQFPNFTHIAQGTKGIKLEDCTSFAEKVYSEIYHSDGSYDLIIMDELNVALDYNLIDSNSLDMLPFICSLHADVYLTGRMNNHSLRHKLYELSDIATNCYCETHSFNKVCSKCGIDYSYRYTYCPSCGKKLPQSKEAKCGREY